ncbi:MAG TPA: LPS export ABC transporter permease LptF [Pseudoduganella sp.]
MIFHRALRRELASSAGASFTVLFSILLTWTLISILGKAAGGKVASSDVIALIAFAALNYLPIVLIFTSFISVLMVVTRIYKDSEMVVWFASGVSLTRFVKPVFMFVLPLILLTGALSFYATPWARSKSAEYIERFAKREDLQKVSPGQFKESSSANRIFFVEGVSGSSSVVRNVFVNQIDAKGTSVVVASEGVIETLPSGDRHLVLKNGRRYQGKPGAADFQSMEFERYSMRVSQQSNESDSQKETKTLPTSELIAVGTNPAKGELMWRLSLPLACLTLSMLAIPLGFVNPRAGSSANLILAVLIFFTYNNLINVFESGIRRGSFTFGMSWWPLHLAMALSVLALFTWRLNVNHRYHPRAMWAAFKRGARK